MISEKKYHFTDGIVDFLFLWVKSHKTPEQNLGFHCSGYMGMNYTYISLFWDFTAVVLLTSSFWMKPKTNSWFFFIVTLVAYAIGSIFIHSYLILGSALLAGVVTVIKFRRYIWENKPIEVILISDHDDSYFRYFLEYYRIDIEKYFPGFDFCIEEEFLVALVLSDMDTVGLIIAEIKNSDTLRIYVDYMIPKYCRSQLAKAFYNCELRCINFLGYRYLYIEPQSKAHNDYLEKIGFRLIEGKYINQHLGH